MSTSGLRRDEIEFVYPTGDISTKINAKKSDADRKFNRAENLRAIPPDDPDFEALKGKTSNAENINGHFKMKMAADWQLARSVGHVAQEGDFLGFQLGRNARTWWQAGEFKPLPFPMRLSLDQAS